MSGIPDHMHRELDALGVRMPPRVVAPREHPPIDQWWKRGEECPH